MTHPLLYSTVGQVVVEGPARASVLERYGLDYCCLGRRPLYLVCQERKIDASRLANELCEADAMAMRSPADHARADCLAAVMRHILTVHHEGHRREVPALVREAAALAEREPQAREMLGKLHAFLVQLEAELEHHLQQEERLLFPLCQGLVDGRIEPGPLADNVLAMVREHNDAGAELEKLRALAGDYKPKATAGPEVVAFIGRLRELDADLHRHMYEENNMLFPLALTAHAELMATSR